MKTICPQEYGSGGMRATPCTRCTVGWDPKVGRCTAETGAEHLPPEPPHLIPTCPIQDRCQHQVQRGETPCPVRATGLICESAFIEAGLTPSEAMNHPLAFNADVVATPEEVAEWFVDQPVGPTTPHNA